MTAIRESICPKLVNIKSVIDITPPEPEEMTQRAEHSDAKVASTTTAREGADREVFHRCSHGGQSRPPGRSRNGPISKQRAFIGTVPCPFGTVRRLTIDQRALSLRKFPFGPEIIGDNRRLRPCTMLLRPLYASPSSFGRTTWPCRD